VSSFKDVATEPRALIDTKNSFDTTNYAANHSSNNCAQRASLATAHPRAVFGTARNTLSLGYNRDRKRSNGKCNEPD
jgi:hypothetical protein